MLLLLWEKGNVVTAKYGLNARRPLALHSKLAAKEPLARFPFPVRHPLAHRSTRRTATRDNVSFLLTRKLFIIFHTPAIQAALDDFVA